MWIKLLESAFFFSFFFSMDLPPLCLFAWLFSALMEELMVHCSYSDTLDPNTHSPIHWLPVTHSGLFWFGLGPARFYPRVRVHSAVSVTCTPARLPPSACPQMPVCVADSLLEHWCLEDSVLYSCDCDINVSICLVQTWTPNPPKAETQRFTSGFAQYILEFVLFFILVFK